MGYKLEIGVLEKLKKTLENNNKMLKGLQTKESKIGVVAKQIKENEKQINLLKNEYYID